VNLVCGTLAGSNGLLRANGGSTLNSAGGGGRIAVTATNLATQAGLPIRA